MEVSNIQYQILLLQQMIILRGKMKFFLFVFSVIIFLSGCNSEVSHRSFAIGDTITSQKINGKLEKWFISNRYNYYLILYAVPRDAYYYCLLICDKNNIVVDGLYDKNDLLSGSTYVPDILTISNDTIYSVSWRNLETGHIFPSGVYLKNHYCPNIEMDRVFKGKVEKISFREDSVILRLGSNHDCKFLKDTIETYSVNSIYDGYLGFNVEKLSTVGNKKDEFKITHYTYEVSDSILEEYYNYMKDRFKMN